MHRLVVSPSGTKRLVDIFIATLALPIEVDFASRDRAANRSRNRRRLCMDYFLKSLHPLRCGQIFSLRLY
jgi:hypothetical protein